MSSSIELQWQSQTERRWRIIKLMLITVLGLVVVFIVLWFWVTQPLFLQPSATAKVSVEPSRLEAHVRVLSEQLTPRDDGHPENLDRVAAYIRGEFERARATVSEQPFQVNGKTYRNVIADFGPETNERIVVGAHYDAAGPYQGADDNASGIAGLIELAHLCGQTSLPNLNYRASGYPALMITDTAFYRNPNYHAPSDRPETLDYRKMAMVVEGVYAAVLALAK